MIVFAMIVFAGSGTFSVALVSAEALSLVPLELWSYPYLKTDQTTHVYL